MPSKQLRQCGIEVGPRNEDHQVPKKQSKASWYLGCGSVGYLREEVTRVESGSYETDTSQ